MYIKDHLWTIRFIHNCRVSKSSGVRLTGYDGEWLTWSVQCGLPPLYASQGVDMGEVAPPHKNWIDTVDWPEPDTL